CYQSNGIPQSIRQGYNFLDSVCRSMEVFRFDQMIGLTGSYEALTPYLSTMYALSDYDPLLYLQHVQYSPTTCSHAYFAPERIQYDVFARLASMRVPDARRIESLIAAAGVYTIRVTDIANDTINGFDENGKVTNTQVRMTVTATIIDTIKGKHWLPGKGDPISSARDGSGTDVIRFSFDPNALCRKNGVRVATSELGNCSAQTNNALPLTYGDHKWNVGSEYIVFLQFGSYNNDGSFDYFAVQPQSQFDDQGGVYPIVHGNVNDIGDFWGNGTSASLGEFTMGLHRSINRIMYGNEGGMIGAIGAR
ncbi:MAG TPA: hypothetical protein VFJ29_05400, partial [Candidatus Kapabacteria bacterium]|nr:hypothetical protein [Candidatus Kapabacteria bacterium]